jgi:hypothetical protein
MVMFEDTSWVVIANFRLSIHIDSSYQSGQGSTGFVTRDILHHWNWSMHSLVGRNHGKVHFPDVESLDCFVRLIARFRLNDRYKM